MSLTVPRVMEPTLSSVLDITLSTVEDYDKIVLDNRTVEKHFVQLSDAGYTVIGLMLSITFSLGSFFNGLCLFVFARNKRLRSPTNVFVMALNLCDFLMCFVGTLHNKTMEEWKESFSAAGKEVPKGLIHIMEHVDSKKQAYKALWCSLMFTAKLNTGVQKTLVYSGPIKDAIRAKFPEGTAAAYDHQYKVKGYHVIMEDIVAAELQAPPRACTACYPGGPMRKDRKKMASCPY